MPDMWTRSSRPSKTRLKSYSNTYGCTSNAESVRFDVTEVLGVDVING